MSVVIFAIVAAAAILVLFAAWIYACVRERKALRRAAEREAAAAASRAEAGEALPAASGQRAVFVDGVYMYTIPAHPAGAAGQPLPPPGAAAAAAGAGAPPQAFRGSTARAGANAAGRGAHRGPTRIPVAAIVSRLEQLAPARPLAGCPSCEARDSEEAAAAATVAAPSADDDEAAMCGKGGAFCQACPVCLDAFTKGDMVRQLPCRHLFHSHCISKWVQRANRCPLCQHEIMAHDGVSDGASEHQPAGGRSNSATSTSPPPAPAAAASRAAPRRRRDQDRDRDRDRARAGSPPSPSLSSSPSPPSPPPAGSEDGAADSPSREWHNRNYGPVYASDGVLLC